MFTMQIGRACIVERSFILRQELTSFRDSNPVIMSYNTPG